jgi:hypothetical protein
MRLWTLHPKYLDAVGLVALWRETLLAREVIRGNTRGYRFHPQLERFRECAAPRSAMNAYLATIHAEASGRGYAFDPSKLARVARHVRIEATDGQLRHEWTWLLEKLRRRSVVVHERLRGVSAPEPHPLFTIVEGPVCAWEKPRP